MLRSVKERVKEHTDSAEVSTNYGKNSVEKNFLNQVGESKTKRSKSNALKNQIFKHAKLIRLP